MIDYKGPDNIYWLFSSAAQSIAAFIGFLTAGFFFVLDKIDSNLGEDETYDEIYKSLKGKYYRTLRILCFLTGFSIIYSLAIVYSNGFDYCLKNIILIFGAILIISTVGLAIYFVLMIIDPDRISKVANELIHANKDSFNTKDSVPIGVFIEKFIILERLLRDISEQYNISEYFKNRFKQTIPLVEIGKFLIERNVIGKDLYLQLTDTIKVRNLAVHGQINTIDIKAERLLDFLIEKFKILK